MNIIRIRDGDKPFACEEFQSTVLRPGEYTHLGRLVPQSFPFEVDTTQGIGFTGYLAFISSVKPTRKLPPLLVPGTVPC